MIKPVLRMILLILSALRLWPHLLVFLLRRHSTHIGADLRRWKSILFEADHPPGDLATFLRLMTENPEFRNLFYYRTGLVGRILSPLCAPLASLYISTPKIGPGLFIQHGFATIIAAKEIGANCWINQQVTIGYSDKTSCPTLGDGVTINAGAKVIGSVTIGSNSVVGANAVVVKDIPPNVTVVGGATRIVRRDGKRVEEKL